MSYLKLITSTNVHFNILTTFDKTFFCSRKCRHAQCARCVKYSKFRKVEFFLMFVSCFKPKTILKLCPFICNQSGANRRSSLFGTNVQLFVNHWYLKVIIYCWILSNLNGSFRIHESFWSPPTFRFCEHLSGNQ